MLGRNYRIPKKRANTRKEYIGGSPQIKITKFTMGNTRGDFTHKALLIGLKPAQIRHTALEATRVAVNKVLADKLGENGYTLRIKLYPHIVLRENKMMAFAGADRLQEGMRRSFGKPIGLAARVNIGQPIVEVDINEESLPVAKEALHVGMSKLPIPCSINIQQSPLQTQPQPATA